MTNTEIRAEICEMINAGTMKVGPIVSFFRKNRPTADIDEVRAEAKELIKETKEAIKGYM